MVIIEKLKKIRDEKGVFVTVLTDLSKAFDCIPHQLLIAKLSAYCFDMKSIAFFPRTSKNENRKQTLGPPSTMFELIGVPQGSIFRAF